MNNTELEALRLAFEFHDGQKRKYTNEPYVVHCISVADIIKSVTDDIDIICAAYLHDTLEDTNIDPKIIENIFGARCLNLVYQVTNVSRPEDGNRATRKQLDLEHLVKADKDGQTIKLADLIHNTQDVVKYDKDFAIYYLREKEKLLKVLTKGNKELYKKACNSVAQSKLELLSS